MRSSRKQLVEEGKSAYLHVMNRVVGREFILGDDEKEYFVKVMRSMSRAMGVDILSYCIMSNHFHILQTIRGQAKYLLMLLHWVYDWRKVCKCRGF